MGDIKSGKPDLIGQYARLALGRIEVLALFPMVILIANWLGFDDIAMLTAFALSLLLGLAVLLPPPVRNKRDVVGKASGKSALLEALDRVTNARGQDTVCLMLQVEDWASTVEIWGHDSTQGISDRLQDRLRTALRHGDCLCKLGDARFGIVLAGMPTARLGIRDTVAARLAAVSKEPIPLDGAVLRLSVAIGHAPLRRNAANPSEATFLAAEAALAEAAHQSCGAIRAYSEGMGTARLAAAELGSEVADAIHSGAIDTWFQPQICAKTGAITNVEALARWDHPQRGLLGPSEILPIVQSAGCMQLLGQTVLHKSAKALAEFDAAQADIPSVSFNLSLLELQNPDLPNILRAEMQRYDLQPGRIALEISGNVLDRHPDDTIVKNLTNLQEAGHRLVLDRAGPQAVPLLALQRFSINQIKLDRALVLGVEADTHKEQVIRAIVALASEMKMETIATGVETPQEIAFLSDLGCDQLQGFGIARPMKRDNVADWVRAHGASGKTIRLDDRRTG